MTKLKKILRSPVTTVVMFVVAIGLLLTGTIGGARAIQMVESQVYQSRVQTQDIGVTLLENKETISFRNYVTDEEGKADGTWSVGSGELLKNMIPEGEMFKLGAQYPEELAVYNSGRIDTFVRVTIYKYFTRIDDEGNEVKATDLDPALINLNLANVGSGWILDEQSTTDERIVLYYSSVLGVGATTVPFTDKIWIENDLATIVTAEYDEVEDGVNYHVFQVTYDYDGIKFYLEAQVDAVQTHNAESAILSAWGRVVSISGNSLSLAD
jgi:hypothetical protein